MSSCTAKRRSARRIRWRRTSSSISTPRLASCSTRPASPSPRAISSPSFCTPTRSCASASSAAASQTSRRTRGSPALTGTSSTNKRSRRRGCRKSKTAWTLATLTSTLRTRTRTRSTAVTDSGSPISESYCARVSHLICYHCYISFHSRGSNFPCVIYVLHSPALLVVRFGDEGLGYGGEEVLAPEGTLSSDDVLEARAYAVRVLAARGGRSAVFRPRHCGIELRQELLGLLSANLAKRGLDNLQQTIRVECGAARKDVEWRERSSVVGGCVSSYAFGSDEERFALCASLLAIDGNGPFGEACNVATDRLCARVGVLHLLAELLDLAIVLLERSAHRFLEVVDENKIGEKGEDVLNLE
mmetsp:Transcript_18003/g.58774  ORF Transcript_18003/g.58774 Transcript_18003/m.58774 type:complete len:358 (-) Transcript_18003:1445-2518(-)